MIPKKKRTKKNSQLAETCLIVLEETFAFFACVPGTRCVL
jgi:hypothetical protein